MSYYSPPSDPYRVSYVETPSTYQTSYSEYSTPASGCTSYSSPYDQPADYYTSTPSRRSPPRAEYYDDKLYYDDVPSPSKSKSHKKRISASGLSSYAPPSSEYRRPTSSSTKHHAPRLLPPPEPERRSKSSKSSGSSRAMVVAPRSPEITRLGTPDMGEIEHGRFCSCCPPMEEWGYEEDYRDRSGKMDSQLSTAKAYISKKKGGRLLEYR